MKHFEPRNYFWDSVLSHSLIVYLSYSPSITFEVGFYADPIRVKGQCHENFVLTETVGV